MNIFNLNQTCLPLNRNNINRGNISSFEEPVVINSKYLVLGDPIFNKVTVYTPNKFGKWRKTREILPPENFTPPECGDGFGTKLQLNGDFLAISAIVQQSTDEVSDSEDLVYRDNRISCFRKIYLTKLDSEVKVKPVDLGVTKTADSAKFDLLIGDKVRRIILPKNGEERFGIATAIHENLFLVGSPSEYTGGRAWLFDLDAPNKKPLKIGVSDAYFGSSVAISKRFVAVGNLPGFRPVVRDSPGFPSKTLIKSLSNDSIHIINSYGELSLSGNILAVMLPPNHGYRIPTLRLFRLDDEAKPHLILERKKVNLKYAFVQNGFLVIVEKRRKLVMCIKPIS